MAIGSGVCSAVSQAPAFVVIHKYVRTPKARYSCRDWECACNGGQAEPDLHALRLGGLILAYAYCLLQISIQSPLFEKEGLGEILLDKPTQSPFFKGGGE